MATSFQQTDTPANASAIDVHCSGNTNNTDTESNQAEEGGAAGSTERIISMTADSADVNAVWMEIVNIDGYDGASGDWTWRISGTTASHNITLSEVHICHVDSSYGAKNTLGSATGLGINWTVAVHSGTITQASDVSIAAGDKIIVIFGFDETQGMSNDFGYTPDQIISAPGTISAGGGGEETVTEGLYLDDDELPSALRTDLSSDGLFVFDRLRAIIDTISRDGLFTFDRSVRSLDGVQRNGVFLSDRLLGDREGSETDGIFLDDLRRSVVEYFLRDGVRVDAAQQNALGELLRYGVLVPDRLATTTRDVVVSVGLLLLDTVTTDPKLVSTTDGLFLDDRRLSIVEILQNVGLLLGDSETAELFKAEIVRTVTDGMFLLDRLVEITDRLDQAGLLLASQDHRSLESIAVDGLLLAALDRRTTEHARREGLFVADRARRELELVQRDGLSLLDRLTAVLETLVRDGLLLADSSTEETAGLIQRAVTDGLFLLDRAERVREHLLRDFILLGDSVTVELGAQIVERLVTDGLFLLDRALRALEGLSSDGLFLADRIVETRDHLKRDAALLGERLIELRELSVPADGLLIADTEALGLILERAATEGIFVDDNVRRALEASIRDGTLLDELRGAARDILASEGVFLSDSAETVIVEVFLQALGVKTVETGIQKDPLGVKVSWVAPE